MTERVQRLLQGLRVNKYPLCIEKFRLANEFLDATSGEPMILRRAKLHRHILDNITIFIEDDDPIAGVGASKPFGLEMDYEYGVWTPAEVESLKSEIYYIDPEDEKELYELNARFARNSLNSNLVDALSDTLGMNDRLWPFMKSGVILPPWKDRKEGSGGGFAMSGMGLGPGFFLICIDYHKILTLGGEAILQEARQCLAELRYTSGDSIKKRNYWEAVIIVFEAWIRWAERYAEAADKKAVQTQDPVRKAELLDMARLCRKVPRKPAESFKEAMQSFWFTFLLACPSPTTSAGRFDQYMYPFYEHDLEEGIITRDEALEWLEILRCKTMKINRVSGKANRAKNAGMAKWYNWTIGGMKNDGSDATNDMSYLLLEAAEETKLPHHTVTVRVHKDSDAGLLKKAMEVVRTGLGMPAFLGDESNINFFLMNGVPPEDARDYCATGCVDANIPGVTRSQVVVFFIIAQAFDIFIHNGFCRYTNEMVGISTGDVTAIKTFDEFKDAFYRQYDYLLGMAAERNNVELISEQELFPDAFRSALMRDGVKVGKDLLDRRFEFENSSLIGAVGGVNVGDSLMAIKKLIFDDGKYTMAELLEALDDNWAGHEAMRRDFIDAPKYGNDIDDVDLLVAEVYRKHAEFCYSRTNAYGGPVIPNAISISAHQPGGAVTGATPDGRLGGEILADASLSPNHGMDKNGPLAVFKSAMKIDADPYQGVLHNMKFHPSALSTDEDLMKLANVVKTYLTHGGKHIQFNVVDRENMMDAKRCPEQHSDLVVRVAGYSAYFTRLTPQIQDEIIDRTSFGGV
jgi:formate C-acetyltransferase